MAVSAACQQSVLLIDVLLVALAVQMLRSEDAGVHYEAVGVLGNLVHSSQEIKQQVLQVRLAAIEHCRDCNNSLLAAQKAGAGTCVYVVGIQRHVVNMLRDVADMRC